MLVCGLLGPTAAVLCAVAAGGGALRGGHRKGLQHHLAKAPGRDSGTKLCSAWPEASQAKAHALKLT